MLTIKREQLQKLYSISLEQFYGTCYTDIVALYPSLLNDFSEISLKKILKSQDERATKEFKITDDTERYKFILLSFQYKVLQSRDYSREMIEILTWPDRESENKIRLLRIYLSSLN